MKIANEFIFGGIISPLINPNWMRQNKQSVRTNILRFVICYLKFVICYLLFGICYLLFGICIFTIHYAHFQ